MDAAKPTTYRPKDPRKMPGIPTLSGWSLQARRPYDARELTVLILDHRQKSATAEVVVSWRRRD